ncbi:hypothetical protein CASFOL_033577 [Castilleja foliolosa]|uniref:Uncharacterized protein n=1 Tax=Castilleja foliolosa TaxID=1961234 RepID=A0ABD3BZ03_9LAMI
MDGFVCKYDLRCKDVLFTIDVGNGSPISSLCFKPGNEDTIYVSAGNEVKTFDLHLMTNKNANRYQKSKKDNVKFCCKKRRYFVDSAARRSSWIGMKPANT